MASGTDVRALRAEAAAFARQHLSECAADLLKMQDTEVLPPGRMQELIALCKAYVGASEGQAVAEAEVKRQALEFVALHGHVAGA